jgi:hypothetical protein
MADVNKLIEQFASGVKTSVRADVDKTPKGFETWTLTGKTDGPKSAFVSPDKLDPAGDMCAKDTLARVATPLEAAHAVREAVVAKGGKRPSVDSWKPVAAKVLGLKRLVTKRWQAVIDAGVEAGLFSIDTEALSYPIIVAAESLPEPEPEVLPEPEPERKPAPSTVPTKLPDDWVPPRTFRCGHVNHTGHGIDVDDPKQVKAREEGFCCAALVEAQANYLKLNPGVKGRPPLNVDWRVKGQYHPVPKNLHRSVEKQDGLGFPGLCCHPETGLYIGGIANNCLYHKGDAHCVVHAPKPRTSAP